MKYLKTYESISRKGLKTLYSCPNFIIEYNSNNIFCMTTETSQGSAILYMADLIRKKSKYLDDPELREVEITEGTIYYNLDNLKLSEEKLKNIKKFRSGDLRYFLDKQTSEKLPIDIYMDLTIKYTPMIAEAIKNVKTLGDVIDNFKIIYKKLEEEPIDLYIAANKYNL